LAHAPIHEGNIREYLLSVPDLFPDNARLQVSEIGDGNINFVYRIVDELSGKSVIVKQAQPYLRSSGKDRSLTTDRIRIESEVMNIQGEFCPDLVPKIYHQDMEQALFVMEDLSDHEIMRKGLIRGQRYPLFPEHIGTFMAHTLYKTSDFALEAKEKKGMQARFINPEMCEITEKLVFTVPYYDPETTHYMPGSEKEGAALRSNEPLKKEVAKLKEAFLTSAQALIHGDLHTGSLFVTETSTKAIDQEFAFYGPMGFDVGAVLGNLLLNFAAHEYHSPDPAARRSFRDYLLDAFQKVWQVFAREFNRLWKDYNQETTAQAVGYREDYIHRLFADSLGFAGCKIIRRIGRAQVEDFTAISDPDIRAKAERLALKLGEMLIMERYDFGSIENVVQRVRQVQNEMEE
jgi:5-methylthioribose kinase